eukprot:6902685-Pyramimonas_sp.AAC.1
MGAVRCGWSLFAPVSGAASGRTGQQPRLRNSRVGSVRFAKQASLLPKISRGSRVNSLKHSVVCVAAPEDASQTSNEKLSLRDVNGIGKVTEAELLKSGEVSSVEALKKVRRVH